MSSAGVNVCMPLSMHTNAISGSTTITPPGNITSTNKYVTDNTISCTNTNGQRKHQRQAYMRLATSAAAGIDTCSTQRPNPYCTVSSTDYRRRLLYACETQPTTDELRWYVCCKHCNSE